MHAPGAPQSSIVSHASGDIDDLTAALINFSTMPSPELTSALSCCCGREQCENLKSWLSVKSGLESRLILSAEVGQALLQRQESYLKRNIDRTPRQDRVQDDAGEFSGEEDENGVLTLRISDLVKDNASLEKKLTRALVNNEVTEVSNKTILQELQEARTTISRLTVHHAKSVGWDTRLSAAMKERDDMQQERDSESQRARLAESRFSALKDQTSKLAAEVRRLQDEMQERRLHRLESSQTILLDARSKLEAMHRTIGPEPAGEVEELTKVLESLVDDSEALKKDNGELQTLLSETREELNAVREELEERRAIPIPSAISPLTPSFHPGHHYSSSVPTAAPLRRPHSLDRRNRRGFEPIISEASNRSSSPERFPLSPFTIEFSESTESDDAPGSPEKKRTHKPLFLLTRSKGVQTDSWTALLSPSPVSSSVDPRSETSSFSETSASTIGIIIDRISSLLNRMSQADALTLTNRLKRQHLHGADVGHLSRNTVSNIVADITNLRTQFRALLEDERMVASCSRKDLRALFKLFRDLFVEMGEMRITLNEVVLDPASAPKVSELALNPHKGQTITTLQEKETSGSVGTWISPISKLFSSPGSRGDYTSEKAATVLGRSTSNGGRRRPRIVPKLSPALSASTTTVNVEFSGSGVGRATTSTVSAQTLSQAGSSIAAPTPTKPVSSNLMGIFAGAPRPKTPEAAWVVVPTPRTPRRVQSSIQPHTSPRKSWLSSGGTHPNRMSRNVDAILDLETSALGAHQEDGDEETDQVGPLLGRTLRRRGLSDSSIHSTFIENEARPSRVDTLPSSFVWPDRSSVLQALSKRVQNFRLGASATPPPLVSASESSPSSTSIVHQPSTDSTKTSSTTARHFLPNLSDWAATETAGSSNSTADPFLMAVGSPPNVIMITRTRESGDGYYC